MQFKKKRPAKPGPGANFGPRRGWFEELANRHYQSSIKPYPFVISNRPEEEPIKHMGTWSVVKIWGGPILTMACVFYLYTIFG